MEAPELTIVRFAAGAFKSLFNLRATDVETRDLSFQLRDAVCRFQLEFANYHNDCSDKHKQFRQSFDAGAPDTDAKFEELSQATLDGMAPLVGNIRKRIIEYFRISRPRKCTQLPVISIHLVNREHEAPTIDRIVPSGRQDTALKKIAEYTPFHKIHVSGTPHLCNYTPEVVLNDSDYKFPGVDFEHVKAHYKPSYKDKKWWSRFRRNRRGQMFEDDAWRNAMFPASSEGEHAFKSHLIVPITFRDHVENKQLNRNLIETLNLAADERSILGFIVADHSEAHYFDSSDVTEFANLDVNTFYVYADMISLLVLMQMCYFEYSSTVNSYLESIR